MGRKGVSKRKSFKLKTPLVSNKSTNGAVSGLSKGSALPVAMPLVREESISIGKKKSSVVQQNDKKR